MPVEPVKPVEQQQGRGVGEQQRVAQLDVAQPAGLVPVQAEHPGLDRPDREREREHRRRALQAGGRGEGRPAAPGFRLR
jgi:hypothetical protein